MKRHRPSHAFITIGFAPTVQLSPDFGFFGHALAEISHLCSEAQTRLFARGASTYRSGNNPCPAGAADAVESPLNCSHG